MPLIIVVYDKTSAKIIIFLKEKAFSTVFCVKTVKYVCITYCPNSCLAIFAITASDGECVVRLVNGGKRGDSGYKGDGDD